MTLLQHTEVTLEVVLGAMTQQLVHHMNQNEENHPWYSDMNCIANDSSYPKWDDGDGARNSGGRQKNAVGSLVWGLGASRRMGEGKACTQESSLWEWSSRDKVNKFGVFCRNSSKFDGFDPHRIHKSDGVLFIILNFQKMLKIWENTKKLEENLRGLVKKVFQISVVCYI
jgi:hypothetical protein